VPVAAVSLASQVLVAAGDPGATRVVYGVIIGLVAIGVALILLGVWLIRQTRWDPPVLAPLERMGDSSWRKRDPATQRRILDEVRPEGAAPLAAGAPQLDADFDITDRPVPELADLGPGVPPESSELPVPDPSQRTGGPTDQG
jgi:hypothetical protein